MFAILVKGQGVKKGRRDITEDLSKNNSKKFPLKDKLHEVRDLSPSVVC